MCQGAFKVKTSMSYNPLVQSCNSCLIICIRKSKSSAVAERRTNNKKLQLIQQFISIKIHICAMFPRHDNPKLINALHIRTQRTAQTIQKRRPIKRELILQPIIPSCTNKLDSEARIRPFVGALRLKVDVEVQEAELAPGRGVKRPRRTCVLWLDVRWRERRVRREVEARVPC